MSAGSGWLLPENVDPDETECLTITIPKDPKYRAAIVGAIFDLGKWFNWERTDDKRGTEAAAVWRKQIIETLEINDVCCQTKEPPLLRMCELPDCMLLSGDATGNDWTLEIWNGDCMGNILIYNGCGCGCGDSSNGGQPFGGGSSSGSGGSGDWSILPPDSTDSAANACDTANYGVDFIFDQADEFTRALFVALDNGDTFSEAIGDAAEAIGAPGEFASGFRDWVENLREIGESIITNGLDDTDLRLAAKVAWIKVFGEQTKVGSVTRDQLNTWAQTLPFFWGNPLSGQLFLPRYFFVAFVKVMNVAKFNGRLLLAEGTSTPALCEYLYSEAQVVPPQLPPPSGSVQPPAPELSVPGYTAFHVIDSPEVLLTTGLIGVGSYSNVVAIAWTFTIDASQGAYTLQNSIGGNTWGTGADGGNNELHIVNGDNSVVLGFKAEYPDMFDYGGSSGGGVQYTNFGFTTAQNNDPNGAIQLGLSGLAAPATITDAWVIVEDVE
jgi:hypothetical protein